MSKALATYFATVNDMPDTEFKVEILEDGPVKKVSVNGKIYNVDYNVEGIASIPSFLIINRTVSRYPISQTTCMRSRTKAIISRCR